MELVVRHARPVGAMPFSVKSETSVHGAEIAVLTSNIWARSHTVVHFPSEIRTTVHEVIRDGESEKLATSLMDLQVSYADLNACQCFQGFRQEVSSRPPGTGSTVRRATRYLNADSEYAMGIGVGFDQRDDQDARLCESLRLDSPAHTRKPESPVLE